MVLLIRAALAGGLLAAAGTAAAAVPAQYSPADRVLFAEYQVIGRDRIPVLLAVEHARAARIAAELESRGARILGRRDAIGYLYVWSPPALVESLPAIDGVQALQIASRPVRGYMDADGPGGDAQQKPAARTVPRGAPPSPALTADNPYTSEATTQALAFKTRHPTFDGRGVVIGFVEPAAPNMATMRGALDIAGKPKPKFALYDLGREDDVAPPVAEAAVIWQQTEAVAPDALGVFHWGEREYRLPAGVNAAGTRWRMARRVPGGMLVESEAHDFLWAVDRQQVWVLPASANGDFSRGHAVSLRENVPWAPIGDEASRRSSTRAPYAFVFAADRKRLLLASAVTHTFHAGMVGSVMAGSGFFGSQANGIAPAAQVAIFHGWGPKNAPSFTGIEQALDMLSDPRVDVAEASYALGDTARFGGVPPHRLWVERLIARTGKPFVKAPGNYGPRLFGTDEFSLADNVFAVGAYASRASWRSNFGIEFAAEHTPTSYSNWGPGDDGALKPEFLGLTHTLAEGTGTQWYWADNPGYEQYSVSGGTSAGAPHGAGHVALLVSAAKQSGVPYDVARLRAAIATTAKFLDGIEARAQGHGLVQVDDAWTALQRAGSWTPATFKIEAPLVGAENRAGAGPEMRIGRGLFELSGWRPGAKGRRELTVTRTGGAPGADRYRLRWKGDVKVFTSAAEVDLPLGKPVKIPVDIQVGAANTSHSAILDLIDPRAELVAGSVLCTVMVSDALPADGAVLKYRRQAPRLGNSLFYVDVPAGLAAMTVKLDKDDTRAFWLAQDPTGRQLPFNPYGSEAYGAENPPGRESSFTYLAPTPGVWQFRLLAPEPRSMEALQSVEDWNQPIEVEVQVRGWAASQAALPVSGAAQPLAALRARGMSADAQLAAVGVGATRSAEVALRPGLKPAYFDVTVDPGATRLEVQLEGIAEGAQVGLYVYKIPEGPRRDEVLLSDTTALVYYDPSFRTDKSYSRAAPPPGRYRIAVDPIVIPAGGTAVSYRDTVYHPLYGAVEIADGLATAAVRAHPEEGRQPMAAVALFDRGDPGRTTPVLMQRWLIRP